LRFGAWTLIIIDGKATKAGQNGRSCKAKASFRMEGRTPRDGQTLMLQMQECVMGRDQIHSLPLGRSPFHIGRAMEFNSTDSDSF
jgi:hypothetical protein